MSPKHRILSFIQWLLPNTTIAGLDLPSHRDNQLNSVRWRGPAALIRCCAFHPSTVEALCKTASIFTAFQRISKACNKEHMPNLLESSMAERRSTGYVQPSLTKLVWLWWKSPNREAVVSPSSPHWFKLSPTEFFHLEQLVEAFLGLSMSNRVVRYSSLSFPHCGSS